MRAAGVVFNEFGHGKCLCLSVLEVMKMIWALLILVTMAIAMLGLLVCEVSCDWVIFRKDAGINAYLIWKQRQNASLHGINSNTLIFCLFSF